MRVLDLSMTLLCWGLWAFFPKLAQKHLGDATSGILYQYLASITLVVALVIARGRSAPVYNLRGALFAIAAGLAATVGSLFYYRALSSIDVSVASALTSLYPSVAILLGLFVLGEKLEPRQWVGVALALASVILIAPRG